MARDKTQDTYEVVTGPVKRTSELPPYARSGKPLRRDNADALTSPEDITQRDKENRFRVAEQRPLYNYTEDDIKAIIKSGEETRAIAVEGSNAGKDALDKIAKHEESGNHRIDIIEDWLGIDTDAFPASSHATLRDMIQDEIRIWMAAYPVQESNFWRGLRDRLSSRVFVLTAIGAATAISAALSGAMTWTEAMDKVIALVVTFGGVEAGRDIASIIKDKTSNA